MARLHHGGQRHVRTHGHPSRALARRFVKRQAARARHRDREDRERPRCKTEIMSAGQHCTLCAEDGGALVWRNEALRVVCVDEPDLPGYTRVIWHAHVPEMTDLDTRARDELMQAVYIVESVQRQILQADKVNLASLGNMTPHLHWHVMP